MAFRPGRILTAGIVLVSMSVLDAKAEDKTRTSDYDITLGIIPIATASFSSAFEGRSYRITGTFKSAGIADVFTHVSGKSSVRGRMVGDRLKADNYNLVYSQGKKTRVYNVDYRDGNVVDTTVTPPAKRNPDTWIPVTPKDLQSVFDPLSGLIFPSNSKICPTHVPIYDGESRLDLRLSPAGTKPFSADGFKGDAIVCKVRYLPKSGYRRGRSDIEYLRQTPMEVWFAKTSDADFYVPVYARIPTKLGPLYVTAVKYGG